MRATKKPAPKTEPANHKKARRHKQGKPKVEGFSMSEASRECGVRREVKLGKQDALLRADTGQIVVIEVNGKTVDQRKTQEATIKALLNEISDDHDTYCVLVQYRPDARIERLTFWDRAARVALLEGFAEDDPHADFKTKFLLGQGHAQAA